MKKLLIALLALAPIAASAQTQVQLARTNQLSLQWTYPQPSITPDLNFVIYGSTNLLTPSTNWAVIAVVSVTNQVAWAGSLYPFYIGSNGVFAWPITPTNTAQYFTIASSNLTGVGAQLTFPFPEIMPLANITDFFIQSHP